MKFDAKQILQQHGFRATQSRVQVLEFLSKAKNPLTVAEILSGLGGAKKFDQVTLYRALEAFVSAGVARQVDLRRGHAVYYELADDHHHHLICTDCGLIKDFDVCDIEQVAHKALKQTSGFATINSHSFELFGLCNTCVKNN